MIYYIPLFYQLHLMVKKLLLLFFIFLFQFSTFNLKAQNLVINPSFEQYDSCPDNSDCNLSDATGWSCYMSCVVYFNSCAPYSPYNYNGVPYNAAGFQYPASGNAYAGEYFYYPHSVYNRGYSEGKLITPLVIGTKYYVTFKVSLCAIDSIWGFNFAVNKEGALFATIPINCDSLLTPSPSRVKVYTNTIITDTLNWTTIQGSFIADSVYKYIIIGNFFPDSATSKKMFFHNSDSAACYYIDDVCVSTDSIYCAEWTGINDNIHSQNSSCVTLFPNPFSIETTVSISCPQNSPYSIIIYNPLGQISRKIDNIRCNSIIIRKDNLPNGIYFYRLSNQTGIIKTGKLIIESKN